MLPSSSLSDSTIVPSRRMEPLLFFEAQELHGSLATMTHNEDRQVHVSRSLSVHGGVPSN